MEGRYEISQLMQIIEKEIDAIYIIDESKNTYVKIKGNPLFDRVFGEKGNYDEMLKALVFHFNDKSEDVAERYHVFLSNLNKFDGKYSKRIKMFVNDEPVIAQMTIYPHTEEGKYIIFLLYRSASLDFICHMFSSCLCRHQFLTRGSII